MKLPEFDSNTYLPAGIHNLTWMEICQSLAWNEYRKKLLEGLKRGLEALKDCGCRQAYLDGSFASEKDRPGDFDVCYEEAGMDFLKLKNQYPQLTIFTNRRELQKKIYNGEFFPASDEADIGIAYLDFFQQIKNLDPNNISLSMRKGIIAINLNTL